MIQFAIGISLVILSTIIGTSQYFDNVAKLNNAENRLKITKEEIRKEGQFSKRIKKVKQFAILQENDQSARIEQTLNLQELRLTFRLTSSARAEDVANQVFYRHEFEITGAANYFDAFRLLNTIGTTKGFVINYACLRCDRTIKTSDDDTHSLKIRGFINVFNPKLAK